MNAKLLFKTVFTLLVLLLLVWIGLDNPHRVDFSLSPLVKPVRMPAALMYFGFFAIGVITATVLGAGGGGRRSAPESSGKSSKK